MDTHAPSLADLAAEYAETENQIRLVRRHRDSNAAALEANDHDLKRLEAKAKEARARLVEQTHRETR